MSSPSPIRLFVVVACLLPLAVSVGCKDERGEVAGPNTGLLDADSVFFTAFVSLSLYNYHNSVAHEVLDIILNDTPTPIFTPSCVGGAGVGQRIIAQTTPQDPMTFTVTHVSPGFIMLASPFLLDACAGFLRITVNKEMIISFEEVPDDQDGLPDQLRYTMTFPDDGTNQPGLVYTLPSQFGGTVLSTTGQVECELVDIVHDEEGRIVSALMHQTTLGPGGRTIRLENRADFLLLVEEVDLLYEWPWPVSREGCGEAPDPIFSPFPLGGYEIAGFTTTFTGPLTGFPVQVEFDGCSTGQFTVGGETCTIDLVNCQVPCGSIRNCNDLF